MENKSANDSSASKEPSQSAITNPLVGSTSTSKNCLDKEKAAPCWKYFELATDKDGKSITKCLVNGCGTQLVYCNQTSSMNKHLNKVHSIVTKIQEEKKECEDMKMTKDPLCQGKLNFEGKKLVKPLGKERQTEITRAVTSFISRDLRPMNIIDGQGFKDLVESLEPRYKIPCRKTITKTCIPQLYQRLVTILKSCLKDVDGYALTFDYWTSYASKSYLTITIHYLDENFQIKHFVLKTPEVYEEHSGDVTAKVILSTLENFGLNIQDLKKVWAVSDAASNMKKTAKVLKVPHIVCFAHILHNTLTKSSWYTSEDNKELFNKCRTLIKYFRHSAKNTGLLFQTQKKLVLPERKLKLDVCTRWNSIFEMIQRLIQNRPVLVNLALEDKEVSKLMLNDREWGKLMEINEVLSPFKDITEILCSSTFPSISILEPIINNIQNNILKEKENEVIEIQAIKFSILTDFNKRIGEYKDIQPLLRLAALLDPRMKNLFLGSLNAKTKAAQQIIESLKLYDINTSLQEVNLENQQKEIVPTLKMMKFNEEKLEGIFGVKHLSTTERDKKEHEVLSYLDENEISLINDPLKWWNENKNRYPNVAKLATLILCIPATSVESERIFSKAGLIINASRASLSSKVADELIFISHNNIKL